ncbi:MAG: CRISPR-associated helicase Cas3' [Candidatus Sumerlaeia bacterium]|nr:CRISPR-associated helicase Cas3' [Candidatus Sumerlaeia bacterium]
MPDFFAHTTPSQDRSTWEPLERHLAEVAARAEAHAAAFDSAPWGRVAGLWHDLGKYHPRFQRRLEDPTVSQPHSGAGACLALERDPGLGQPLAAVIAGHHTGLVNWSDPMALKDRLDRARKEEWPDSKSNAPPELLARPLPKPPAWVKDKLACEFWTRMLFSALVDADRLCTEEFTSHDAKTRRSGTGASPAELAPMLEVELTRIEAGLDGAARARDVNRARAEVSRACREAAALPPGFFSLTVPTGGGKTLAAMRFALHHAAAHGLRRAIVVIPFTSIIEQNARAYARVFGAENVLEHHSNLDIERRKREAGEAVADWQDLAAENWDAPIVVTTTVQFFESLFTNHPSRARKLHNIARSAVILDEVQSLPPELLMTILDGLRQLSAHYGCSVVLSTATPPALRKRTGFNFGLEGVREIVPDPVALAARLRRVRYHWPAPDAPPVEWPALADEVSREHAALVVTHRRADARELAQLLEQRVDPARVLHLSALMCPAHRLEVLGEVRRRLHDGEPCLLVSTQLIEAGVDVDFPVVFRALGGLHSVVQAAGRCNREGRHAEGRVVVFHAPSNPPKGVPQLALDTAIGMLREEGQTLDADDPRSQESFFRKLYSGRDLDEKLIQSHRAQFNFATVAEKFKLIEDCFTRPVVVPYDDAMQAVGGLQAAIARGDGGLRNRFRALQPYTISINQNSFDAALKAGALVEVCEGLHHLRHEFAHHYHAKWGLVIGDDIAVMNPESLMVVEDN